jgi:hypothetical protein
MNGGSPSVREQDVVHAILKFSEWKIGKNNKLDVVDRNVVEV